LLPALVYLTDAPISVHFRRSQVNNWNTLSATALFVNLRTRIRLANIFLAMLLTFRRLVSWPFDVQNGSDSPHTNHLAARQVQTNHGNATPNFSLIRKQTMVIPLAFVTFTGSRWKKEASGQHFTSASFPRRDSVY
jgi:hypothetical protein